MSAAFFLLTIFKGGLARQEPISEPKKKRTSVGRDQIYQLGEFTWSRFL